MAEADPVTHYVFTDHTRFELRRRGLSETLIASILNNPEQRWEIRKGRHVLQSRIRLGSPRKTYLVRVIVDIDRTPCEIVTAYRTSKLSKYWRNES